MVKRSIFQWENVERLKLQSPCHRSLLRDATNMAVAEGVGTLKKRDVINTIYRARGCYIGLVGQ